MDVIEIDAIAVEYAKFYLGATKSVHYDTQENIRLGDRLYELLLNIGETLKFQTNEHTSSAKWFFDLYKHLNQPAPAEIKEYFAWCWADMENENAQRTQEVKLSVK